jgi:hypothetical protein
VAVLRLHVLAYDRVAGGGQGCIECHDSRYPSRAPPASL